MFPNDRSPALVAAEPYPKKAGRRVLPPRLPATGLNDMFRNNYVMNVPAVADGPEEGGGAAAAENTIVILDDDEENEAPPPPKPDKTMVEAVGEELMGLATGGIFFPSVHILV